MKKCFILAAGIGKRMLSEKNKVFHKLFGYPIIYHIVKNINLINDLEIFVVTNKNLEEYRSILKNFNLNYIIQDTPLGTGDALKKGLDYIKEDDNVLVIPGDTPLVKKETIDKMFEKFVSEKVDILLLTTITENPTQYGRIIRENGKISMIKEDKDLLPNEKDIKEINSGVYIFKGEILKKYLPLLKNENKQGEFYLTDVINLSYKDNKKIDSIYCQFEEIIGINTRKDLMNAFKIIKERKIEELLENGVTIYDPITTYISPYVTAQKDTEFYPGVYIEGEVHFGKNCKIGPFVKISAIDEVVIVEDNVTIGPFASIRDGTKLMKNSKAKTFVEIKKSTIGENSSVPHLSYIGDATIGKNVNIGAGTITCNFDGKKKHPTIIEDDVFIGSDSILVAKEGGLFIRKGSYTGAGSVITEDVPPNSLALGRARQINKENYFKREERENNT
ncbi:MAG: bifunctional UDP-N-acetylglucosamine diphosphorylase/glucosamine-1-phosphate N-acetyltransferase GlmU [Caldisericia bacterium]|nr:bifunctional UDP-N-acetylglucosamine diphosphorylase/glucosamine-1-phosphate N-acetyltransferase GlmU [Caldisericia bacterium]